MSAPSWAAYTALLNQAQGTNLGFINAVVYPLSMKVRAAEGTAQDATNASTAARHEFESAKSTVSGTAMSLPSDNAP